MSVTKHVNCDPWGKLKCVNLIGTKVTELKVMNRNK